MKTWIFLFITISSVIQVSYEYFCSSSSSNSADTEETNVGSSGDSNWNELGNGGSSQNWDGENELGPFGTPSHLPGACGGGGFSNRIYDVSGEDPCRCRKNLDKHFGEGGVNQMYYGGNNGGGNELDDNANNTCDKKMSKKEKKEKDKKDKKEKKQRDKERKEQRKKEKQDKKQREKEEKQKRKKEKKEKKSKCKCKKHKKHK